MLVISIFIIAGCASRPSIEKQGQTTQTENQQNQQPTQGEDLDPDLTNAVSETDKANQDLDPTDLNDAKKDLNSY